MRAGIVVLVAGYGLSQFYRMFLSVLAPELAADIGASGSDIAQATGLWFLAFAAMQIPIGGWLESLGPRRTVGYMLALGGAGGGLLAALAQDPLQIKLAMVLIGIGCAPVMISSYYIYARSFSPAVFATLAGATIGFGGIGNIAGTAPLAWAVGLWGWRETMGGLAAITLIAALAVLALVRDPPALPAGPKPRLADVLRLRMLWPVLAMLVVGYAPSAGLSGGWGGPYFADAFGATSAEIGRSLLFMSLAIVAGSFACGPAERLMGDPRRVVIWATAGSIIALLALWLTAGMSAILSTALLTLAGFCGAAFPVIIAHGKTFLPAHLTARGMTLMNLFSIGGVGLIQLTSAPVWRAADAHDVDPAGAYGVLFLYFAAIQIIGLAIYLTSRPAPRS